MLPVGQIAPSFSHPICKERGGQRKLIYHSETPCDQHIPSTSSSLSGSSAIALLALSHSHLNCDKRHVLAYLHPPSPPIPFSLCNVSPLLVSVCIDVQSLCRLYMQTRVHIFLFLVSSSKQAGKQQTEHPTTQRVGDNRPTNRPALAPPKAITIMTRRVPPSSSRRLFISRLLLLRLLHLKCSSLSIAKGERWTWCTIVTA